MKRVIISTSLALFLIGCGAEEEKSSTNPVANSVEEKVVQEPLDSKDISTTNVVVKSEVEQKVFDAKSEYLKCAGCHGSKAEKSALNKSKILANLSKSDIESALIGYKNDTYGGSMKGLMKGQVNNYTEDELKDLSEYIFNLR